MKERSVGIRRTTVTDKKEQQQSRDQGNPGNPGKRKETATPPQDTVRARTPTADDLAAAAEAAQRAAQASADAAKTVADALHGTAPTLAPTPSQGSQKQPDTGGKVLPREAAMKGGGYEAFMGALQPFFQKVGDRVRVKENAGWVKIEGVESGERVYVSRSKRTVTRITCTLPPEEIPGAKQPGVPNGLIRSHLPADPEAVGQAILKIAGPSRAS